MKPTKIVELIIQVGNLIIQQIQELQIYQGWLRQLMREHPQDIVVGDNIKKEEWNTKICRLVVHLMWTK